MKYRSPSPDAGLLTPPDSPSSSDMANSAVTLLNSLEAFYQQERYWVHHTRASLELALSKGIDAPSIPPTLDCQLPSPPSSSSDPASPQNTVTGAAAAANTTTTTTTAADPVVIKSEPDNPSAESLSEARARSTRWLHRKNGMKLKLDGISHHHRRKRPHRASPSEPRARLLEMFSELMDARMESCQRVQRLVRSANRTDLFM
ncbi:hypothetical protein A0H81_04042 [Grifola frondosa]|uniref:Uncharacterized protein n=1 Tax=Grifola frondosa TaxID=5627 RepID=A0A1C7MHC9_GRIFR|nr:hypothetical protein A0H81_04042 [Grifola frondosa]